MIGSFSLVYVFIGGIMLYFVRFCPFLSDQFCPFSENRVPNRQRRTKIVTFDLNFLQNL